MSIQNYFGTRVEAFFYVTDQPPFIQRQATLLEKGLGGGIAILARKLE